MDKPVCLETEVVWPLRNGIAMAALLTMVLVAALESGVPVRVLTHAVCVSLATLGVALGGFVPRMQRSGRNDESGDVVAILMFGYAYLGSGWVLFRWVFDDWDVAFEVAQVTGVSFVISGWVGVLLLTLVRGTTRELLIDVGFLPDEPGWPYNEEGTQESPCSLVWSVVTYVRQVRATRDTAGDWAVDWDEEVRPAASNRARREDGRQANDRAVSASGGSNDADRRGRHLHAAPQECVPVPELDAASPDSR